MISAVGIRQRVVNFSHFRYLPFCAPMTMVVMNARMKAMSAEPAYAAETPRPLPSQVCIGFRFVTTAYPSASPARAPSTPIARPYARKMLMMPICDAPIARSMPMSFVLFSTIM